MRWVLSFQFAANRIHHAVQIAQDFVIPKSDGAIAISCQLGAAVRVSITDVLSAIQLDDQFAGYAREIHDGVADRMLPSEFPWPTACAERIP